MVICERMRILCCIGVPLLVFCCTQPVQAQTANLEQIGRFATVNGTAYFLPGGYVSTWGEDGNVQSKYYKYEDGKFSSIPELPQILQGWKAFDWSNGLDVGDRLSAGNYDPALDAFLPKEKNVKSVEQIDSAASGGTVLLVCFAVKTTEQGARSDDTDIYIAGFKETRLGKTPAGRGFAYNKISYERLWMFKAEPDAIYGAFTVQTVPGLGRFAVLYWGDVGGSGGQDAIDVYRIN
jgi:hypothetical protein